MMCRSTSDLSLLVPMQFFPNYRITLTTALRAPPDSGTPSERLVCVSCPIGCTCDLPKRVYVKVESMIRVRGGGEEVNVYYESIKRDINTKTKEFTRLAYTGLVVELEHLKIETRLIDEKFAIVKGGWSPP